MAGRKCCQGLQGVQEEQEVDTTRQAHPYTWPLAVRVVRARGTWLSRGLLDLALHLDTTTYAHVIRTRTTVRLA